MRTGLLLALALIQVTAAFVYTGVVANEPDVSGIEWGTLVFIWTCWGITVANVGNYVHRTHFQ